MINDLKKMMMKAKLERDTLKGNLLSTLIAEAVMVGKNDGNRETTEAETLNVIKKFLKNVNENIKLLDEIGKDKSDALREKEILESLLPKQLSEEELYAKIVEIVATLPDKSPRQMGVVMAALKKDFDGQYDGKAASSLVKKALGN
ncbi:GatB/YqeY domain-containing protein [bacterium]|nr:GatB/YqeY domain-containing protein [bacterium]MBR6244166.1 GatB/YqeY domain-containing protein [bacterium]